MTARMPPTGLVRVVSTAEAIERLRQSCQRYEERYGVPTAQLELAFVGADSDDLEARANRRAWRHARDQLARLTTGLAASTG